MITQNITLDLSQRSSMQHLYAKQGDNESRCVRVTLMDNGTVYTPTGVEAHFRARKPDGTMICNPATINEDGTVTLELTGQTLAAAGTVLADVCLCGDDGQILSSASFAILVEVQPYGEQAESSNEWQTLWKRLHTLELGEATEEQITEAVAAWLQEHPPAPFVPTVSVDGQLSWSNAYGLSNPESVDIVQMVVDALGGAPVFGVVDDKNTITVSSVLADGTYVLQYEDPDGNLTRIGTVTVGEAAEAVNLFDPALASLNYRWSNSSYAYTATNGYVVSDYIPVVIPADSGTPAVLHWRGALMADKAGIAYFDSSKAILAAGDASTNGADASASTIDVTNDANGDYQTSLGFKNGQLQSNWQENAAYVRVCLQVNTTSTAITQDDIAGIVMTIDQLID